MREPAKAPAEAAANQRALPRPAALGTTAGPTPAPEVRSMLDLQGRAGNRAVARMVSEQAVQRDKTKVKDDTQESRIKAGEAAPTLADVIKARVGKVNDFPDPRFAHVRNSAFLKRLTDLVADDAVFAGIVQEAQSFWGPYYAKKQQPVPAGIIPTAAEVKEARDLLAELIAAATTPAAQTGAAIKAASEPKFTKTGARASVLNKVVDQADLEAGALGGQERAKQLLGPSGAKFGTKLTSGEKKAWAAALKKLPAVADLMAMHKAKKTAPGAQGKAADAQWAGGGSLQATAVKTDDKGANPVALPTADPMYARIVAADAILKRMVENSLLSKLKAPIVQVRPQKQSKFRAFQNEDKVNVASDEAAPVVVHETGHYIEEQGGLEAWADIQKLLHQRHEAEGGGVAVAGPSGKSEGRYKGSYGATGKYTSSIYKGGSTEVMSMTVEYLANPKKLKDMIEKDPLQAAVVLRALEPTAYAGEADLRQFDAHMPS